MKASGCSAIFDREKRFASSALGTFRSRRDITKELPGKPQWATMLFALAFIAAWQMGTASPAAAQAKTKVNPKDGLTYVWIAPGTFRMGCSPDDSECQKNEKPVHSVKFTKGFWIGQTLVTQAAYKKVIGSNPSTFKGDDRLPVDTVSRDDASAYCKRVDMRLPTEAEWEYAARGGSPAARYAPLAQIAWYSANSMGKTHEVARKKANGYGLYDMLGNLWEWVADWYGLYRAVGEVNPKGPATGPAGVLRGGSWYTDAYRIRTSSRLTDGPTNAFSHYGFRCVGD
jgi:formylglycine-generating enzyme required for sulfatase activity